MSAVRPIGEPWLRLPLVASWREIVLVILLLIGPSTWRSAVAAWHGSDANYISLLLNDSHLWRMAALEAIILALFLVFLQRRGWTGADLKIRPGLGSSSQALLLVVVMELANIVVVFGGSWLLFELQNQYASFSSFFAAHQPQIRGVMHAVPPSWAPLIGVMVLNAFYEEIICIGYVFNQLAAKWGPGPALLLVVLLRASCHTYQGPVHALGVAAAFVVSGFWYWRTRNLWTLIFSHALMDLAAGVFTKLAITHFSHG